MARETPQNHLLLYFHEELSDDPVCLAWLERSPTSCVEVALSEISLVFTRLDSCDVSCVIAGHSVPGKRMRVPIKAASKIEKSLAWMMEEELAVALDKVHLTHTRRNDTEVGEAVFLILSAEHHYLRAWLDTLARYRIHPQRLVPIHALIPESSTGAGLRLNDQLAYSDHNSCGLFDADSPPGVELLDSGVCEIAVDVDEFHDAVTPTTKAAILSLAGTDTTSDDNAPDSPVDDQGESPAPANAGADGADDDPNKSHRPVSDGADGADGELGEGRALASAGADGELGEGHALASAGADSADDDLGEGRALASAGADGELGEGRTPDNVGADGELGEGRALASAGADSADDDLGEGRALASAGADGAADGELGEGRRSASAGADDASAHGVETFDGDHVPQRSEPSDDVDDTSERPAEAFGASHPSPSPSPNNNPSDAPALATSPADEEPHHTSAGNGDSVDTPDQVAEVFVKESPRSSAGNDSTKQSLASRSVFRFWRKKPKQARDADPQNSSQGADANDQPDALTNSEQSTESLDGSTASVNAGLATEASPNPATEASQYMDAESSLDSAAESGHSMDAEADRSMDANASPDPTAESGRGMDIEAGLDSAAEAGRSLEAEAGRGMNAESGRGMDIEAGLDSAAEAGRSLEAGAGLDSVAEAGFEALGSGSTMPGPENADADVYYERRLLLCRWIERNLGSNNAISLLTGKYMPKSHLLSWQKLAQYAVWSASLSGVALGIYLITFGALFYIKANQLEQQSYQRFRELFPNVREIRDIRRQAAGLINNIKRGGSSGSGLGFAEIIEPIEVGLSGAGVNYEVFRIRFNQADNKFLLSVYTDSIASANIINASLNAQGFETKLLSADSNSSQIAAIFSINTAYRSQS